MSKISIKAVIIGGLVDVVATDVMVFPLAIVAALSVHASELPKAEQAHAVATALQTWPSFHLAGLLIGAACSVLGGYVAARIAKVDVLLNAALTSWLCTAIGIYSMFSKPAALSPVEHVLALVASPALAALGGALWLRAEKSRLSSLPAPMSAA